MSVQPPRVTVVIPAWKAERTLARAIDSVLRQPGCAVRAIVVVDGPGDRTEEVARAYGTPRVGVVVNSQNRGVAFSRNAGLAEVRDPWVMFLDADDFIEPPLLSGLIEAMEAQAADVGFGPMQVLDERSGRRGPVTTLSPSDEELFAAWLSGGRFAGTCSVLWRTEALRGFGGWDPHLNRQEDGELVLRAMLMGARTARSDAGCGVYVKHDSPGRLTRRSDNLEALLAVPAKLLGLPGGRFPAETVRRACAANYYAAARTCYTRGARALGDRALGEARALGFRGHGGTLAQVLLARMLGLRIGCAVERRVRRLAGKALGAPLSAGRTPTGG